MKAIKYIDEDDLKEFKEGLKKEITYIPLWNRTALMKYNNGHKQWYKVELKITELKNANK